MQEDDVLSALIMMVEQYLTIEIEGERVLFHDFMSAGEYALDVLEEKGIVTPWQKKPAYYIFSTDSNNQSTEGKSQC